MKNIRKPIYYGIFLDEQSHKNLFDFWKSSLKKELLSENYGHHMTIKFKPSDEEIEKYTPLIGQKIKLKVIGFASDEKAQAVLVSSEVKSTNINPHITISVDVGVAPSYSNELLANGFNVIDGPELTGTFDQFPRTVV